MPDRLTPPAITDFTSLTLPTFTDTRLHGDIQLYILDSGEEPVSRLTLLWPVGQADVDNPAPFMLLTYMLSEGCEGLSGKEVSDILESNGAWLKVTPYPHALLVTLHFLNDTADKVIPLLGKIITTPTFPAETLESIKKKCAAEKEVLARRTAYRANIIARQALFGNDHPQATDITSEMINNISRDDMVKVYSSAVLTNRPIIFLSGKIEQSIIESVKGLASQIASYETTAHQVRRRLVTPLAPTDIVEVYEEIPGSLQTGIIYQIPTINPDHPDYEALRFAVVTLGGYFGSRLMSNIREDKGYTYGIRAAMVPEPELTAISISCECDNAYTPAVIGEIKKEIDRLATELISSEEMEIVRNIILSGLAGVLDSPFYISNFREQIIAGSLPPETYARRFAEARKMTPQRIQQVAAKYLRDVPAVVALAGTKPG
ncbi:MAG: insulinase family protein [Muribaculaceae bacterium]|nr:insulinase family protein [Muribaculaceae bacterium]